VALARRTIAEYGLDVDVWIDDLGDQSRAMFGDLPNPAIVVDAAGTVQLKLSWCEPKVLGLTLPEIPVMVAGKDRAPADAGFLAAIETAPAAGTAAPTDAPVPEPATRRHHRDTMLAHLVCHHPDHPHRARWLAELAASGPPQQRDWASRLLPPTGGAAPR